MNAKYVVNRINKDVIPLFVIMIKPKVYVVLNYVQALL